ncbi:hypothetical protein FACS189479_04410 [Spirochaetia bacterium]|nr:hypothetical protein FACS189479_04410 [Spirochaetia bacterium]
MAGIIGSFEPDNLFAGAFPVETAWVPTPADSFPRGTLVTIAGAAAATGGAFYGILAEDSDKIPGSTQSPVYLSGTFDINKVLLANGSPVSAPADIAALRVLNIYVKTPVTYYPPA